MTSISNNSSLGGGWLRRHADIQKERELLVAAGELPFSLLLL